MEEHIYLIIAIICIVVIMLVIAYFMLEKKWNSLIKQLESESNSSGYNCKYCDSHISEDYFVLFNTDDVPVCGKEKCQELHKKSKENDTETT